MIGGDDQLLQQPQLVVGVEDGEIGLEPDQLGVAAQHLARATEWKVPSQGMPSTASADDPPDPLAHLARRLVGEGDGEDLGRPGAAGER